MTIVLLMVNISMLKEKSVGSSRARLLIKMSIYIRLMFSGIRIRKFQ